MEKQLDELKAKMEKSGLALAQFEKDLDVINPGRENEILSARLLQLNTEYTAAQGERVSKEAAWNAMKSGSLEAAQVSHRDKPWSSSTRLLTRRASGSPWSKRPMGAPTRNTARPPPKWPKWRSRSRVRARNIANRIEVEYRQALNREQILQTSVAETKAEWDRINSRSFEYQQLKREADADKALYDELIRKIREADINAGFQNNNIRIADVARPPLSPVSPNIRLNIMLAFLFSTLLAIGAALLI